MDIACLEEASSHVDRNDRCGFQRLRPCNSRTPGSVVAMTGVRTTKTTVTFRSAFRLAGFDGPEPAGTYDLEVDEEIIEGNDRTVYRRIATLLILRSGGTTRTMTVNQANLEAALARDRE